MNAVTERTLGDVDRGDYKRYWLALYRRDVAAARAIVDEWLKRHPPRRIYLRLFEPALALSGAMFGRGRIHWADEHFVTYQTLRLMRVVRGRFVRRNPTGPLAFATGVGQESHLIGLRMVCDFLQADNWRIGWYPSNDRATVLAHTRQLTPRAVLLSVGLDTAIEPARRLIAALRRDQYPGLIIVGGRAVSRRHSLVQELGADLTAANGLELVRRLRPLCLGEGVRAADRGWHATALEDPDEGPDAR